MDYISRDAEELTLRERVFPYEEAFPDQLKLLRWRLQWMAMFSAIMLVGTGIIDLFQPPANAKVVWITRIVFAAIQLLCYLLYKWEGLTLPRMVMLAYVDYFLVAVGIVALFATGEQSAAVMLFHPLVASVLLLPIAPTQSLVLEIVVFLTALSAGTPALRPEAMGGRGFLADMVTLLVTVVIVNVSSTMAHRLRLSEVQYRTRTEEAHKKLNFLSSFDHLTRVANRRNFEEATEAAVMDARFQHQPIAYLQIDLDYFKQINDTYGHQAGDAVLRAASERIAGCLRTGDHIGRVGGDEFAALIRGASQEVAVNVAERILKSFLATQLRTSWGEIPISCTVGVAWYAGEGSIDTHVLTNAADESLYIAKEAGRGRVGPLHIPPVPESTEPAFPDSLAAPPSQAPGGNGTQPEGSPGTPQAGQGPPAPPEPRERRQQPPVDDAGAEDTASSIESPSSMQADSMQADSEDSAGQAPGVFRPPPRGVPGTLKTE